MTSSRPVSIHQFTVFRFRFRCSRRFNPGVLITSSQLQSCSRGPVVFIWCQSPGCSLCKRICSLSWAYPERKSQIWPYIYNQRKQSSSTYFENERSGSQLPIWKQLDCNITAIMYMSSIYTVECRYNAIQCYKIFHTALRGLKHDINQGSKSHIIPHISP